MNKKFVIGLIIAMTAVVGIVLADWHSADFNDDGMVNLIDVSIIRASIGSVNCTNSTGWCNGTDMNFDGGVTLQDVSLFTSYLGCNENSSINSSCWQ